MSNFDPMYNQNWGQPNYNAPRGWQTTQQTQMPIQPNTNVMFVTSPEEALIKTNMRNSDMVYFDQDKNVFYRVKVDMEGRKSWAQFTYALPDQEDNTPATKADIATLLQRIETLEAAQVKPKVVNKKTKDKEVVGNAESDE